MPIKFKDLVNKGVVKVKDTDQVKVVSISDVIDKPIIIHGYKTNVKTKYGGDKLIIYFNYIDNDERLKLYTNSKVLLDIVTQIPKEDLDNGGVEATIIKNKTNGMGYYKLT